MAAAFDRPEFGYDSSGQWRRRAESIPTSPRPLNTQRQELLARKGYIEDALDIAHMKDPEIHAKVMRDPVICKAITLRKHLAASTGVYLEAKNPDSRQLIAYYDDLIEQGSTELLQARMGLTSAIFDGMAAAKMSGQTRQMRIGDDTEFRQWWFPRAYDPIPKHAIKIVERWRKEERGGKPVEIPEYRYATLDRGNWFEVDPEVQDLHYLWLTYARDAYTLGYGRGLLQAIYFYWFCKTRTMKSLLQGLDRFGWPFIIAKIAAGSSFQKSTGGGGAHTNAEWRADAMVDALAAMRADANIIAIDQNDSIELVRVEGQSIAALLSLLQYYDKALVELILASSMPTGGGEAGSFARAAVEAGSTSLLIQYDRLLLEGSLQNVINACHQFNRTNWQRIHVPMLQGVKPMWFAKPPKLRIGREEDDDVERWQKRLTIAREAGLKVRKKDIYAACGLPAPDDGDEDIIDYGAINQGMPGDPKERAIFEQQQAEMQAQQDAQAAQLEAQAPAPFAETREHAEDLTGSVAFTDRMRNGDWLRKYLAEHRRNLLTQEAA